MHGIIASGISVWTPAEKLPKPAFISPPIEEVDICTCRYAFGQKTFVTAVSLLLQKTITGRS